MLTIQVTGRGADGEQSILQTGDIVGEQADSEVDGSALRSGTDSDEARRNTCSFVVDHAAPCSGFCCGESKEGGEEERGRNHDSRRQGDEDLEW